MVGDGREKTEDDWFAENVRIRREERGWNQSELAKRLRDAGLTNFHPTTVSRLEKGERAVRISEAALIARVLDSSLRTLTTPQIPALRPLLGAVNVLIHQGNVVVSQLREWGDNRSQAGIEIARVEVAIADGLQSDSPEIQKALKWARGIVSLTPVTLLQEAGLGPDDEPRALG